MKNIIIGLMMVGLLLIPGISSAQDTLGQGLLQDSVEDVGLESDLENSLANIISTALALVGTIFLILTVAAGIMWMTAAGNEERIAKAKKILVGAIIGLIVSMTAYTITYFVTKSVSRASDTASQT